MDNQTTAHQDINQIPDNVVATYPIQCLSDGKWTTLPTDRLLPGDVVSVSRIGSVLIHLPVYSSFDSMAAVAGYGSGRHSFNQQQVYHQ